jgi:hypothetical protein
MSVIFSPLVMVLRNPLWSGRSSERQKVGITFFATG